MPTIRIDEQLWDDSRNAARSLEKPLSTVIDTFLMSYILNDTEQSPLGLPRRPNGSAPRKIATFYANKEVWEAAKAKARGNGETISNAIMKFLQTFVESTKARQARMEDGD